MGILGWPTGHGLAQVWGLSRNRNRVVWWSRATNPGTSLLVKPKVVKYWRNLCTCFPLNLECLWLTSNSSVETSLHWVQRLFSQFEMNNGCHLISSKNSRNFQPWNISFFWSAQVIGAWRDDDGAVYTITMDASGDSASASIKRQDGRRFEAKETIKCGEQGWSGDIKTSKRRPCHSPKEGWNLESLKGRGAPQWCIVFFPCIFPMVLKDSIGSYNWFYIFRRSKSKPSGWWRTSRGMEWPALKDIFLQSDFRLKGENRGHNHKIIVPIYREIKQYIQM